MRSITVTWHDGDTTTTAITGTNAEILAYYVGQTFNVGIGPEDRMKRAVSVQFHDRELTDGVVLRKTDSYPTRFCAFDEPGVLFEQNTIKTDGGFECCVLSLPVVNAVFPHIKDGLYMSVTWNAGNKCFVGEIRVTQPTRERKQFTARATSVAYGPVMASIVAELPGMIALMHDTEVTS